LKGETAKTNPSRARYSTRLRSCGGQLKWHVPPTTAGLTSRRQERSPGAAGSRAARPGSHRSGRSLPTARVPPHQLHISCRDDDGTYLGGSVNLSLPDVLALSEHGRSTDLGPVLSANQVCSLHIEQKRRSVFVSTLTPLVPVFDNIPAIPKSAAVRVCTPRKRLTLRKMAARSL
jgi:hypothetical protein